MTYHTKIPAKKKIFNRRLSNKTSTKSVTTNLLDMNNTQLVTGDILIVNNKYRGVLLYNSNSKCYGIFFGFWYPPFDTMNPESYGKFVEIPSDNGMRMHVRKVGNVNERYS